MLVGAEQPSPSCGPSQRDTELPSSNAHLSRTQTKTVWKDGAES